MVKSAKIFLITKNKVVIVNDGVGFDGMYDTTRM